MRVGTPPPLNNIRTYCLFNRHITHRQTKVLTSQVFTQQITEGAKDLISMIHLAGSITIVVIKSSNMIPTSLSKLNEYRRAVADAKKIDIP